MRRITNIHRPRIAITIQALAALALGCSGTVRAQGVRYNIVDLGTLGGWGSQGVGIDDHGRVAGWSFLASGDIHGFLTTVSGKPLSGADDIGTLPGQQGSFAYAVSATGTVAGAANQNGVLHAIIGDPGIPLNDLGTLVAGGWSIAQGINVARVTVGGALAQVGNDWRPHAFWWPNGPINDLNNTIHDAHWELTAALGINNNGSSANRGDIVGQGWIDTDNRQQHAFLLAWGIGVIDLGPGFARAVNSHRQAVGAQFDANGVTYPTEWTNGLPLQLSLNPGVANDINGAGKIVGTDGTSQNPNVRAWLWDPANGLQYLDQLISQGSGWQSLNAATGINNCDQIGGFGIAPDGQTHAFLMTPVTSVQVKSLAIKPTAVHGTQSATGTVTLNRPAPQGGVIVNLDSYEPNVAQVPATVFVPGGARKADFNITTSHVQNTTHVAILACYGKRAQANLTVKP